MAEIVHVARICRGQQYNGCRVVTWQGATRGGIPLELLVHGQAFTSGPVVPFPETLYAARSTTEIVERNGVGWRIWHANIIKNRPLILLAGPLLSREPREFKRLVRECSDLRQSDWRGLRCLV